MRKSNSRKGTERSEQLGEQLDVQWDRVTTIGIDLSDRMSQCCAIDDEANIVAEFRVATEASSFEKAFRASCCVELDDAQGIAVHPSVYIIGE